MQSLNDEERREILGDVLADELKVIREYVQDVPELKQGINDLKQDVDGLKSDMKIVKAAVVGQSRQLKDHEQMVSRLEVALPI